MTKEELRKMLQDRLSARIAEIKARKAEEANVEEQVEEPSTEA